jgi:hypothetical protein
MSLGLGPLSVLQTLRDKEPFYRRGGISEGTGDCPLDRASGLGDDGFRFIRYSIALPALSCFQSR